MNIASVLREHAIRCPEVPAVVDCRWGGSRSVSYARLEREAGQVAAMLKASGLREGDPVLVLQPMSKELYTVLAAIFRLGMVAMFLDPTVGREHVTRCCQLRPPQALIAGWRAHWLRLGHPALRRIPRLFSIGGPAPGAAPLRRAAHFAYDDEIVPCEDSAPALLTFTSGSTAAPKAALRSHGFLLAQHRALESALQLTPGERDLTTQPIFVLANLASRVTSLIPGTGWRRHDAARPGEVVRQLRSQRATRCGASPALLERLAEYCEARNTVLPELNKVFTGGGPVTPRLVDRLRNVFPNAVVTAIYGCTEAEPIATVDHAEMLAEKALDEEPTRGLLAGRPSPLLRLRILRDQWGASLQHLNREQFRDICLDAGQVGEIVVSGRHVLPGYVDGCGDHENKFDVAGRRWHRTGDAGYLDGRGRLWLLGRCGARIEDARGVLFPFTVEQAAAAHPCVRMATVVNVRGERVLAVETRNGRLSRGAADELLNSLAFAGIDRVRVLPRMPVDQRHRSKIDYAAVTRRLERST